jgi:hypothetical protein
MIGVIIVVIIVIGLIYYMYSGSSTSTAGTAAVVASSPPTYPLLLSNVKQWDGATHPNDYPCPNSFDPTYCIFDNLQAATTYCTNDANCVGVWQRADLNPNRFQLAKNYIPVANNVVTANYYPKTY